MNFYYRYLFILFCLIYWQLSIAEDSGCCCQIRRNPRFLPLETRTYFEVENLNYYVGFKLSGTFGGADKKITITNLTPEFSFSFNQTQGCDENLYVKQNTFGDEPLIESFKYELLFGSTTFLTSLAVRIGKKVGQDGQVDLLDAVLDSFVDASAVIGVTALFSPGRINNAIGKEVLEAILRDAAIRFLFNRGNSEEAGKLLDRLAVALGMGVVKGLSPQDLSVLILCKKGDFKADLCNTAIQAAQNGLSQGIQEAMSKALEFAHDRPQVSTPLSLEIKKSFLVGSAFGASESLLTNAIFGATRPIAPTIMDEAKEKTEASHYADFSQNYAEVCLNDSLYRHGGIYGLLGEGWNYTMGTTIHASDNMYDPDLGPDIVVHENVHCQQYMKYGLAGFFVKPFEGYLWQIVLTGRADCHPTDDELKYRCNGLEGEAVKVETGVTPPTPISE